MDYTPEMKEFTRPRRRRKNYSLVFLTGFTLFVIIFAVLSCTVLFQITQIKITGSSVYTADEIAKAAAIEPGKPLVTTKIEKIKDVLLENFIYVDTVTVKKEFPATIAIEVVPSVPTASIETEGGYLYLSAGGKVLELASTPKEGTMIFTGAKLSPAVKPGVLIDITAAKNPQTGEELTEEEKSDISVISTVLDIAERDLGGITEKADYIDVSDAGGIKIMYDNRIELSVGGLSDIEYKSKFLMEIIETKIGPNTYGKLTMLSSGNANFIDSDGLKYNEKKYQENLAARNAVPIETDIEKTEDESE